MEKDREEFEKWKKEHSMNLEITIRDSNGDYQYIETRRDWYVWQNAIATLQAEIDALRAELMHMKSESEHAALVDEIGMLKDDIDDLTEARNRAVADVVTLTQANLTQWSEIYRLKAENERLRDDAERYRWLREDDNWEDDGDAWLLLGEKSHLEFDEFIDAAMKESK